MRFAKGGRCDQRDDGILKRCLGYPARAGATPANRHQAARKGAAVNVAVM